MMDNTKIKIGLALGGGGARGFAHIGALQVLEENGIFPDIIAGTSMGSVVGGVYSYGKTGSELEKMAEKFNSSIMMDVNVFNILRKGIFSGNRVANFFKTLTNDIDISQCKTKFIPVSVDILTGKEYHFKPDEKLYLGIRASMGVPGVFKPLEHGKMLLVDGGVCNNLPADVARQNGADFVISVDVMGKYKFDNKAKNALPALINSTFTCMIAKIDSFNREKNCDVLIDVSLQKEMRSFQNYSFGKKYREKMILAGRKAMLLQIEKIKQMIKELKDKNA